MERREDSRAETYSEIEKLIEDGDLAKAPDLLIKVKEYDAEWHYLYSLVYLKKHWYLESKKSLKTAIKMDPENPRYHEAMEELKELAKNATPEEKREERARAREERSEKYGWCCDVYDEICDLILCWLP